MIKNKKIFVTGGAGFIANCLISRIVEQNKIIIFDNFLRDTLTTSKLYGHKNISIIKGDVLDFEHVRKSMQGADSVVHMAAIAGIDTVVKHPTVTMRVNMIGTANVLEACLQNNIKDRIIDFSTSEVFGSMAFKPTEDNETVSGSAGEARWTYAVSKLAGEHLSMAYHREFGLPTVSVRPFNIYGPGQTGEGAMLIFIKRALMNEDIHIYGDGNQIRAWCFVDDFINGLLLCMEHPAAPGESFNIGNPRAVFTTYGLAQTICRVLKSDSQILFKPALTAEIELRIPSVEKIKKKLGFAAQVDVTEGIERTAAWVKNN